jgi:hypothetical protein
VYMEEQELTPVPNHCPVCGHDLVVTRLECSACATEVTGGFTLGRLASLREPHASLIEMFLRVRGNVKDMERELGLSYPTVRARLDEAFNAAGFVREGDMPEDPMGDTDLGDRIRSHVEEALSRVNIEEHIRSQLERGLSGITEAQSRQRSADTRKQDLGLLRRQILDRLERGEIEPDEAAALLRDLQNRSR